MSDKKNNNLLEIVIKSLDSIYTKIIILIFPIVFIILFNSKTSSLILYPNNDNFRVFCFTDIDGGGNSIVQKISEDSLGFKYVYTLKNKIAVPYAGFTIAPIFNDSTIDISDYSFFKIDISASSGKNINFFLRTLVPDFTIKENSSTHCFYQYEIPLSDSTDNDYYLVNYNDLQTPYWWYEQHKFSIQEKPKETWTNVLAFDIESGVSLPCDVPDTVTIKEISIHQRKSYTAVIFSAIIYYLIFILLFFYRRFLIKQEKRTDDLSYTKLESKNEEEDECEKVISFIADNFQLPDLTVEKISKGSRVSVLKIPVLIRKRFDFSVPEYVNTIRLTEAKRLLKTSDMQIIQIALAVGYNNVSHFNRKFKVFQKMSPLAYRKSSSI